MLAEEFSPPPEQDSQHTFLSNSTPLSVGNLPPIQGRKRKRAPVTASSPAPSDPGSTTGNNNNATELLASRADLSSRPILTISRGPIFIPTAEGSEYYKTDVTGVNRIGFRYVPAGINPPGHASPCRTIESSPTTFRVSWEDRSPFLKVTKDGLGITGNRGFRSARCNAPIREGKWYMEIKIIHGGGEHIGDEARREGSHVRLGWGRREAPLNGPVGLDGYSYGYRDKSGEKVTLSRPRSYGQSFHSGDVVGMYISLPPRRQPNPKDPHDPANFKRERIPIDLKGQEVFEILEYPQSKEMISLMDYSGKTTSSASVPSSSSKKAGTGKLPERGGPTNPTKSNNPSLRPLPTLPNSRIAFFVNGRCQGIAFQDLYDYLQLCQTETQRKAKDKEKRRVREGVKEHRLNPFDDGTLGYYPFISLFNDACVRLNPGPDFEFPPPPDVDALLDAFPNGVPPEHDIHTDPSSQDRTWRPACERYPEFMAEQWALDALEEEDAKIEAARFAALDKAEEEKRIKAQKRREQANARKRAKKAAADQAALAASSSSVPGSSTPVLLGPGISPEDERFSAITALGSNVYSNRPSPSPLRQATAFDLEGSVEMENSPAPTYVSYGDFAGNQSGYNSDNAREDIEMEQVENGPEEILQEQDNPTSLPLPPPAQGPA